MKRIIAILLFTVCILTCSVCTFAETADKTALTGLLNETFDANLYTKESYLAYQLELSYALDVSRDENVAQNDVDEAYNNLKAAIDGLIPLIDRDRLLYFIDNLETILYSTDLNHSDETLTLLNNARSEFLALYAKVDLTTEELTAAEEKFNRTIEQAEKSEEFTGFSPEFADEGIIVPDRVIKNAQTISKLATIRVTMIIVGLCFTVVGIVMTIVYLRTSKRSHAQRTA